MSTATQRKHLDEARRRADQIACAHGIKPPGGDD
jgi:hypothetical protein